MLSSQEKEQATAQMEALSSSEQFKGKFPQVTHLTINHQVYTIEQMQAPAISCVSSKDQALANTVSTSSVALLDTVTSLSHCPEQDQNTFARSPKSWLQEHFAQLYGPESFALKVADFLAEWFDQDSCLKVQTSGSTGTPKQMRVSKERMCNSARLTVSFLGLKAGDKAHLCMPMQYIAGKMVVVRALIAGLNLIIVEPSGRPLQSLAQTLVKTMQSSQESVVDIALADTDDLDNPLSEIPVTDAHLARYIAEHSLSPEFSAMIPMQVFNTLNALQTVESSEFASVQEQEYARLVARCEIELLKGIKQLIIGGGSIDESLACSLKEFPHAVWSTYGMTETLSHIALRRLSGQDASEWYSPFEHVYLKVSSEQTLVIDAPLVAAEVLHTNDIVEFNDKGQFKILGRKDNTINTGGVKVQIEQVEAALKALKPLAQHSVVTIEATDSRGANVSTKDSVHKEGYVPSEDLGLDWPFMISYAKDIKFGQIVVLLLECQGLSKEELRKLERTLATLPAYWQPKLILYVDHLPQTGSGKPDRAGAVRLVEELMA